jgi:hypothetical protein
MSDNQNPGTLRELYQGGLNVAQGVCGIITTPVEYALRPFFGTRYFDPIQMMFTCLLMTLLPLLGGLTNMLPIAESDSGGGYVGLGTVSMLFFVGSIIHAPRLWRRVFNMELEQHSQFEGEPLPFFEQLPLGKSFWAVRVLWEPAFVATLAIILRLVTILDRPAMVYLLVCAVALAVKNYLCWYQAWLQLRTMMDTKFAGPLVAKAVTGKATEKELARVHLAGFAGSVPPEIRAAAILQMAPKPAELPSEIAQLLSAVEPPKAA